MNIKIDNKLALGLLMIEWKKLIDAKAAAMSEYDQKINAVEASIELLSGKKVWKNEPTELYDDTNPDYIKQSIED